MPLRSAPSSFHRMPVRCFTVDRFLLRIFRPTIIVSAPSSRRRCETSRIRAPCVAAVTASRMRTNARAAFETYLIGAAAVGSPTPGPSLRCLIECPDDTICIVRYHARPGGAAMPPRLPAGLLISVPFVSARIKQMFAVVFVSEQ